MFQLLGGQEIRHKQKCVQEIKRKQEQDKFVKSYFRTGAGSHRYAQEVSEQMLQNQEIFQTENSKRVKKVMGIVRKIECKVQEVRQDFNGRIQENLRAPPGL